MRQDACDMQRHACITKVREFRICSLGVSRRFFMFSDSRSGRTFRIRQMMYSEGMHAYMVQGDG